MIFTIFCFIIKVKIDLIILSHAKQKQYNSKKINQFFSIVRYLGLVELLSLFEEDLITFIPSDTGLSVSFTILLILWLFLLGLPMQEMRYIILLWIKMALRYPKITVHLQFVDLNSDLTVSKNQVVLFIRHTWSLRL